MAAAVDQFAKFNKWPSEGKLNVCIVGAGNLCHVLAGQLGARPDVVVTIYSRKAASIQAAATAGITVKKQARNKEEKDTFVTGRVAKVSDKAQDVIPEADFIIMTTPSHARRTMTELIIPHVDRKRPVFFGVMPGMGGFDWIARQICKKHNVTNVVLWAIKDVPFMSAWCTPGVSVTNLGPKTNLYLAMASGPPSAQAVCGRILEALTGIPVVQMTSYMAITLTPGNPIMHPSIMYGMFGPHSQWDGKPLPEKPLFYEAVSELSSYFLSRCDAEVQAIKNAITAATGVDLTAVWPLRENLKKVYGPIVADNRTLMLAMRTNRAYETIRTPLKQVPGGFTVDVDHRFFLEDVPFGLVILRDLADLVEVKTPYIDEILVWCQGLMGKEYLVNGKLQGRHMNETGAATQYGAKSIYDCVPGASPKKGAKAKKAPKSKL
jgi:hypothetical protein